MNSTYLHKDFISKINKSLIKIIIECGSRDGLDAIALSNYYKPEIVYSFECNPESIIVCNKNLKGIDNIKLIEKAVYYENKHGLAFYATDMEKCADKNIGASSLFVHIDPAFIQKKILVEGIRLDTFMQENEIQRIDLLCMDLQGAEYLVIEGLGERIKDVKYIITEISLKHYYYNDILYKDMVQFMHNKGFHLEKTIGKDSLFKKY